MKKWLLGQPRSLPFGSFVDDFLIGKSGQRTRAGRHPGRWVDTRAYRITGIEKTHVFEVDAPATRNLS